MSRQFTLAFILLSSCSPAAPAAEAEIHQREALPPQRPALEASRTTAIVIAAERVAPAVVSVNVIRRQQQVTRSPFDFFFVPRRYDRLVEGFGSGFIISEDGIIITNQHVTEGAEQIVVTTRDGVDYTATLLGEDPLTDIAVLQVVASGLPVAPIGTSRDLMIGEWVVAFGNPYAYLLGNTEPTVTAGVVSATGRNLLPSRNQLGVYVGMIQTDAAINPGNSGGPLTNALGEVVGVNTSIFSNTGESVGIGFAIPVERALRVAAELGEHGSVRRAWLGLSVASSEDLREWKQLGGIRITDVAPGGPAHDRGLRNGDILLVAGGKPQRTFLDWEAAKLDIGVDDSLEVTYMRGNSRRRAFIRVRDLPTATAERVSILQDIQLISLTPAVRQERRAETERGALVFQIGERTSQATGLRVGDIIVGVNRRIVNDAEDALEAIRTASGRSRTPIRVYFERSRQVVFTDFYISR